MGWIVAVVVGYGIVSVMATGFVLVFGRQLARHRDGLAVVELAERVLHDAPR